MSESTPQISPETRKQMESICRRALSGRRDAGRVGEELYGHLEDKLLAYLRGDERLSEADAMILVREHFGRPEALRSIFKDVHRGEAADPVPVARRLLAVGVATSAIGLVTSTVGSILVFLPLWVALRSDGQIKLPWFQVWHLTVLDVSIAVGVVALFLVIRRWRRNPAAQDQRWFARWHPGVMVGMIAALLLARIVPTQLAYEHFNDMPLSAIGGNSPSLELFMTFAMVGMCIQGLQCLLWMLWTRAALAGAAGWVGYGILCEVLRVFSFWAAGGRFVAGNPRHWIHLQQELSIAGCALGLVAILRVARWVQDRMKTRLAWQSPG